MVIDGKAIAERILSELATRTTKLKDIGVTPHMAVILAGEDPASQSYVRQKAKAAERIGATLTVHRLAADAPLTALAQRIDTLNTDPTVHGIIIQRPLPAGLSDQKTLDAVVPTKDVDGFNPGSPFTVPVARGVGEILNVMFIENAAPSNNGTDTEFRAWLRTKHIAVIGRGVTAGKPIADYFLGLDCATSIITSTTPDRDRILREADIIVSCVGKAGMVPASTIKPGAILISVGIWRDESGKLHGDYEPADIEHIAAYYTPTPGGVGPVNVACLMANLVDAAERLT